MEQATCTRGLPRRHRSVGEPALWASIVDALEGARWFVLFLSPAAASSVWVGKEVEHWLANKPADHIIPVLTAGELVWDPLTNDFDPSRSTAVPPALLGALREEPRHLDLRWAHDETQLDLRNGRFRDAIADIAAPIHGIPKENLESEDVRLHRRARRLARGAVAALLVLFVASIGATALALTNASRADDAAEEARAEAERAMAAEDLAQERQQEAEEQRAEAERQRQEAEDNLRRALSAEELAELEAERAFEEQTRAEEQAVIAESERVRAQLAPLCDAYSQLSAIETNRHLYSVGELYESDAFVGNPVTDANRDSRLRDLEEAFLRMHEAGDDVGLALVAVDALYEFPLRDDVARNDGRGLEEFLDDPRSYPAYERDYPVGVGEGPEGAYDYWDGFVVWTYDETVAEMDFVAGGLCPAG